MLSRTRLGWDPFFEAQCSAEAIVGRVVSGRLRHDAAAASDLPAVGDWVTLAGGVLVRPLERRSARLPRSSRPGRPAAGRRRYGRS